MDSFKEPVKIEDMIVELHCCRCNVFDMEIPLIRFRGPVIGTLHVPNNLQCIKCLAVLNVAIRKCRDDELVIYTDGNVGIGSCPSARLDISGELQTDKKKALEQDKVCID